MKKYVLCASLMVLGSMVFTSCSTLNSSITSEDNSLTVVSVEKTKTEGNVDTYIITFSDGTKGTFTVTNGVDGEKGDKGDKGDTGSQGDKGDKGEDGEDGVSIVSVEKTNTEGNIDTYTITYSDGNKTTFTVTNGSNGAKGDKGDQGDKGDKGEDGNSIVSIEKTNTEGNIDTYTITFSNGTTFDFYVTNGLDATVTNEYYSITFDLNEGSFKGDVNLETYQEILKGDSVTLPTPYREGYIFEGWYTGRGINDNAFYNYLPVTQDLTLVAKWVDMYNIENVRQERTMYVQNAYSYLENYVGLDSLSVEDYEQFLIYLGNINFAASFDELNSIYNEFIEWVNKRPINSEEIEGLKVNLESAWNNFVSTLPDLESEYLTTYEDLMSRLVENISISDFENLRWEIDSFVSTLNSLIEENTFDPYLKEDYLNQANDVMTLFDMMFIDCYDEEGNPYYESTEINIIIESLNNATNNVQLSEAYFQLENLRNYLLYDKFYSLSDQITFLKTVANNIHTYASSTYEELKIEYNLGEDYVNEKIEYQLDDLYRFVNSEDDYLYQDLHSLFITLTELEAEFSSLSMVNKLTINVSESVPYDFFMMNSSIKPFVLQKDSKFDITSYVTLYESQGFVFEGVYFDSIYGETISYYEDGGNYYIDITEENGFHSDFMTVYFNYKISNPALAKIAVQEYYQNAMIEIEQLLPGLGLSIENYSEAINEIEMAIENIEVTGSLDDYMNKCINFATLVQRDALVIESNNQLDEILGLYPELEKDETYLNQYKVTFDEALSRVQEATSIEELSTIYQEVSKAIDEIRMYASSTYGER